MLWPLAVPFVLALITTALVTPVVAAQARRFGFVARPTQDRWHNLPTALMGGIAIFLGWVLAASTTLLFQSSVAMHRLNWSTVLGITAAAIIMFVAGVLDDVLHFRPAT